MDSTKKYFHSSSKQCNEKNSIPYIKIFYSSTSAHIHLSLMVLNVMLCYFSPSYQAYPFSHIKRDSFKSISCLSIQNTVADAKGITKKSDHHVFMFISPFFIADNIDLLILFFYAFTPALSRSLIWWFITWTLNFTFLWCWFLFM